VLTGRIDRAGRLEVASTSERAHVQDCEALFYGYIANRGELCRRLGVAAGSDPSQAELVARAFRAWGAELHEHVLGQFAAVVVDGRTRRALLTRDSVGLAPLFYSVRGDVLAFSTHLTDLVDAAAADLDEVYLADYIALGRYTTARTPYRSIARLLPGRSLRWAEGRLKELQAWNLADVPAEPPASDAELAERFRELLTEAVRGALPRTGPVWSDLSGGLDSSSVTSVAALLDRPRLSAFSVVAPGWGSSDELRWMSAVVDQYDLPWQRLDVRSVLPFSRLPSGLIGEPTAAIANLEQAFAKDDLTARHGVTATLSGYGGDVVLGAFSGPVPTHLADPLFDGHPIATLRAVRDWARGAEEPRSYGYWLLRCVVQLGVDHMRGRSAIRGLQLPLQHWISRDYARAMRVEDRSVARLAPRCRQPGRQQLADRLWASAVAVCSVPQRRPAYEVRCPLLDRRLVEFMSGIPWDQRLRPDQDRHLQRRALEGVLPERVRRRDDKGTGSRALIEGLRQSPDWFEYLTDDPLMARHGIADAERWRQAVRQARVGQLNGDQFFMAGVAIEAWLRQLDEHRRELLRRDPPPGTPAGSPRTAAGGPLRHAGSR
jgi:asparagine synthase (glutamine-hydrolysing)